MANYVRMGRISGTHGNGGMSRARRAVCFLMEGAATDIKAGTVSSRGCRRSGRQFEPFRATLYGTDTRTVGPGARTNGAALARPLEFSAREKGVQFILHRHMDEIIREQQFSGRVIGIKASYSPRVDPVTGARLESLWQNGNIDERRETIFIRARKAVIVGAGGHGANPQFRSMFYAGYREPAFVSSGWALLGPRGQDASGIIAGYESRREPRGDAAEPLLRPHVPHPRHPCDARLLHHHASGSPDVLVARIDGLRASARKRSST